MREDAGNTEVVQPSGVRKTTGGEMQGLSQTQDPDALLPSLDPRMFVATSGAGKNKDIIKGRL